MQKKDLNFLSETKSNSPKICAGVSFPLSLLLCQPT